MINEWLANPSGADNFREWVELTNEGEEEVCFGGASIRLGAPWAMREQLLPPLGCLPPGGFVLLGDGGPARRARAGGIAVDASYGSLEMPNAAGVIAIACEQIVLASVHYGVEGQAGVPLAGHAQARAAADDPWGLLGKHSYCDVHGPSYDGRDQGTPGAVNESCRQCRGQGGWRAQRPIWPGELTIGAALTDPIGPDRDREWLRLDSAAVQPLDLSGLELEVTPTAGVPRRYPLLQSGCGELPVGASCVLPVFSRRTSRAPCWVGATLPNQEAQYRLLQSERLLWQAAVPKARANEPVVPVAAVATE